MDFVHRVGLAKRTKNGRPKGRKRDRRWVGPQHRDAQGPKKLEGEKSYCSSANPSKEEGKLTTSAGKTASKTPESGIGKEQMKIY